MRLITPATLAALSLCAVSQAQVTYDTTFEDVAASAAGTVLTGQDGYYVPPGTTSVDFAAYTYAGNTLGVPAHPNGGANFIAGTGPGSPTFARAQRDVDYGDAAGMYVFGYDICVAFTGTLPTAQNAGSFSVQPFPGSSSFIALARWVDPSTATSWNADYVWFDAAGTQLTESVADPGFQNLQVGKWYRWETEVWLNANKVNQVRITDLATNATVTHNPVDRYLLGGSTIPVPPTGFRFFAGGGAAGNTLAFDNAHIERRPLNCKIADTGAGCGPQLDIKFAPVGSHQRLDFTVTNAFPSDPIAWIWGFAPANIPVLNTGCFLYQQYVWGTYDNADPTGTVTFQRTWSNSLPGWFFIQVAAFRIKQGQLDIKMSNGKYVECL